MESSRVAAALIVTLLAARAAAVDTSALRACESALRTKVHARHPASGRVEVRADSVRQRQSGRDRLALSGGGQVETRSDGWRRLTFECTYDTRARTVASLRYDIASAASANGGAPLTPTHVCKRAVSRRIHDDHPASGKIRWKTASIAEQPAGDDRTTVTGAGRIQTRYGDWRRFTFSCTYDARSGSATRATARFP